MSRATTFFLFLFFPLSVWGEVVDQVAALVEGEVITLSEVQQLAQYKGLKISEEPNERRNLYLTVLDQIINQKLISREAQHTPGIQISNTTLINNCKPIGVASLHRINSRRSSNRWR